MKPGRRTLARSAGVRFALLYAGLFGLSALALAMFLWWSTAGLLERETVAAINADTQGLHERYTESGLLALASTIEQRIDQNVDDDAIYLLATPELQPVAGNLPQWPPSIGPDESWAVLAVNRDGMHSMARVHQFVLEGGFRLLVGRDVRVAEQMARLLTDAMLWAAAVVIVLGIAGALTVRSLFRITLADVSAVSAAIGAGDLSRRVRASGRGDEFDVLADTINDMLDRIGRLMDGVRQVSNAIAHDLRTPIARARARLEDAARPGATEAELRAAIERAQADLDAVVRVFEALLRIAEIETGARRSAFASLDLSPLLLDLAELYEAAAEEAHLVLEHDIPPHVPAFGDREMIQQAVVNLLDNAFKFSPRGGHVRLSAASAESGPVVIVSDQGPGIPEADRARATERFFRAESARSTPGSGLGLALVQAVAGLHGGSLRLEDNAPGLRAVLSLARPRPRDGRPGAEVTESSPRSQQQARLPAA